MQVSGHGKAAGKARDDVITDSVNQIIVEGVVPIEEEHNTILNCYKGKRDALERGNYMGLKLTDWILETAGCVSEKLIRY